MPLPRQNLGLCLPHVTGAALTLNDSRRQTGIGPEGHVDGIRDDFTGLAQVHVHANALRVSSVGLEEPTCAVARVVIRVGDSRVHHVHSDHQDGKRRNGAQASMGLDQRPAHHFVADATRMVMAVGPHPEWEKIPS